jgi:hypothetical protein
MPPLVFVTFTTAADVLIVPAGVNAVIVETVLGETAGVTTTFVAGEFPIVTVAPVRKPDPVIVTGVPPATGPVEGEIEVIVGLAT